MFDLKGHVSVITGGNGGIGLGMARGLAKSGASIAVWGRNLDKNGKAVIELKGFGVDAKAFQCDVTKEDQIVKSMADTLAYFGRVDSCFANSGTGISRPVTETTMEDWTKVLDVNLTGVFMTFREAAKHIIARGGGGKLIATASIGSIHGMPRNSSYSATKAGVIAIVRSLAVELGRYNIQANAIIPGWIATDMTVDARAFEKLNKTIIQRTPAHRWGEPRDFEGLAVYLASRESDFQTGTAIAMDGGYTIF
ncbi:MAG: SDR family oxidoreductase [Thermodesulfobacteriota bacterium]|jgi:NAD(P)-dependent dehydrogenase (short-subunit alcohol dehydrogenase family)